MVLGGRGRGRRGQGPVPALPAGGFRVHSRAHVQLRPEGRAPGLLALRRRPGVPVQDVVVPGVRDFVRVAGRRSGVSGQRCLGSRGAVHLDWNSGCHSVHVDPHQVQPSAPFSVLLAKCLLGLLLVGGWR